MSHKVYFAAPMFAESELMYNAQVVERIRKQFPELDIYLPQEETRINDKTAFANSLIIAQTDTDHLLESDTVIAILDGLVVDPGVASEIGVAYQAGLNIIGIFTDSRVEGTTNQAKLDALQNIGESQFPYVNLYTVGLVKNRGKLVGSIDELIENLSLLVK